MDKSDISNLTKNSDLQTNIATLATKAELKAEQNRIDKSHFKDDGTETYLVIYTLKIKNIV